MSKIDSEKIQIIDIKVIESSIINKLEVNDCSQLIDSYKIDVKVENSVDPNEKILKESLTIALQAIDKEGTELDITGKYVMEVLFKVENLDEFLTKEENDQYIVDSELGVTLTSIAYSTCRGIIYSHASGSALKGIIIPIVKPAKLMLSDK